MVNNDHEQEFYWRIRGACFGAYYWFTGRRSLLRLVSQLDEMHMAPRSDIDRYVARSLLRLLRHAAMYVPYYRELISQRDLSESTVISALERLPVLTKAVIRQESHRLVSERACHRTRWNTSGGSTGEPIKLLQDHAMRTQNRAAELLFLRWAGHRRGDPHVLIWGVPKATFNEGISLHERVFRWAHNETYLNCYKITDEALRAWVEHINARRPALIEAYVDAICELSHLVIDEGLSVHAPRGIITSAGVLTSDARELITHAFGCPILNRYGSREVGDIACSCTSGNELHVNEPVCYIEIVDQDGNPCEEGVEGDLLVTLLTNDAMPLIRYRIEDRGAWASGVCPCGRTTKRLAYVSGRQTDYLLACDGSHVNGTALTTLLYPVPCIRRYQYRQVAKHKVTLAVMPKDGVDRELLKSEMRQPLERLRTMLGNVSVELAIVDEITPSRSGKYRYILNDLADGNGSASGNASDLVHTPSDETMSRNI